MRTSDTPLTPTQTSHPGAPRPTRTWHAPNDPHADELVRHIRGLSKAVLEVTQGIRPVYTLTRWVSPSVCSKLEDIAALVHERDRGRARRAPRPAVLVGMPRVQTDGGRVDAAVVIYTRSRARAMTLILEPHPRTGHWILLELALL